MSTYAGSVVRTTLVGTTVVLLLFSVGVALLVGLNSSSAGSSYRDVALLFGAAVAAAGAVTASLVAFGSAQKVEEQKDLRERTRRIDYERAQAEYAIISLHVVATNLDRIYKQACDDAEHLSNAASNKDLRSFVEGVVRTREAPLMIRILEDMEVGFLKDREQMAIREIQVCLDLLSRKLREIKDEFSSALLSEEIIKMIGDAAFWSVCESEAEELSNRAKALFNAILPYINAREPGVSPDETKLALLLGVFASEIPQPIISLDDLRIFFRRAADDALRQHVSPEDLRASLHATADQVRDEDGVPLGSSPTKMKRWQFPTKKELTLG